MEQNENKRKIKLAGADNARDLGGLMTRDGAVIRPCRLIRSNHLGKLTPEDEEKLVSEFRLRRVIDLRTEMERRETPDLSIPGVEFIHIPIFEEIMAGITHEKSADQGMEEAMLQMPDMTQLYARMVREPYCIGQFAKAIAMTLDTEGAVLWHCTEGKDRCGLLTVLILFILGVDCETVYADYLLTNQAGAKRSGAMRQKILDQTGDLETAERMASYFLARKDYLDAAVEQIVQEAGSLEIFVSEWLHISAETQREMRKQMLVKPDEL